MQVVDVEDAGDVADGAADVAKLESTGRAFEEDVEGLANDVDRAPDDHAGDAEGEYGVEPHRACGGDRKATDDDGGGGESVAEHVEEDAADVDVSGGLPEHGGDGAVHQNAGGGDDHHQLRVDGYGGVEAVDGGDADPGGEDDEGEGVDEGREDTGALIAEGLLVGSGTGLEVDSGEGEEDRQQVGDVVAGLGDECEGVGSQTVVEGREDVSGRERHRELQDALHLAVRAGDHVHGFSVSRGGLAVVRHTKSRQELAIY